MDLEDKNPVFDLLGANSDDIQALVAYSLYKKHKREWADTIRQRDSRDPTADEDVQFANVVATASSLERFRQDASSMLVAFANQVVDDARPNIEEEAVAKRVEKAAASIEQAGKFWPNVGASIIASGVTISILVALTIAAELFGIDIVDESSIVEQIVSPQLDGAIAD